MAVAGGPWEAREVHGLWYVARGVDLKPMVGAGVVLTEDNARYIADSRTSIEELTEQIENMHTAEEYEGLQEDCDGLEVSLGDTREDLERAWGFIEKQGLTAAFEAEE